MPHLHGRTRSPLRYSWSFSCFAPNIIEFSASRRVDCELCRSLGDLFLDICAAGNERQPRNWLRWIFDLRHIFILRDWSLFICNNRSPMARGLPRLVGARRLLCLRAEPPFISALLALQRRHIRSDFIGRPDNCLWHSLQLVFGVSPFGFYTESDERSLRNCRYIDPILLRHLTRIANLSPRTGGDSAKQRNACHHADCIISLWNTRPVH